MKKRILSFLLAFMLVCSIPFTAFAEDGRTIHISSAEDLQALAQDCVYDLYSRDLTVILDADIDLQGEELIPIPIFDGTFEGGGHMISGFQPTLDGGELGLFRVVAPNGVIRSLKVDAVLDPAHIPEGIGGIAGINYGEIRECTFSGSLHGYEKIGGIAGENYGTIASCWNEGRLLGKRFTGGIAGYNEGLIIGCVNRGSINTSIETAKASLEDLGLLDLSSINLVSAGDSDTVTDTGGIVGLSSGTLNRCENYGSIGYQHYGYNVGGIAGRQSGYIVNCKNYGVILGRKDVGGIVGQMEPHLLLTKTESLTDELLELSQAVNDAMSNLERNSYATGSEMGNLKGTAGTAAEDALTLNETSDKPVEIPGVTPEKENDVDWAEVGAIAAGISSEVSGALSEAAGTPTADLPGKAVGAAEGAVPEAAAQIIDIVNEKRAEEAAREAENQKAQENLRGDAKTAAASVSRLGTLISTASAVFAKDMQAVNDHYYKVASLAANLLEGNYTVLSDISDLDTNRDTNGKVYNCINYAEIAGDINIGGIGGEMGIEMENDLEGVLEPFLNDSKLISNTYETRCVVRNCVNSGAVSGKKKNVGGAVGATELGSIFSSQNYGSVTNEEGENAGGIVGYSVGAVYDSYSMCSIAGSLYVGGIAGYGNRIQDCVSLVEIRNADASFGTIAGWADVGLQPKEPASNALSSDEADPQETAETGTPVSGNYYVHDTIGAIDGISYAGIAEPITYEELLTRTDVPERFSTLRLVFVADGETVSEISFPYGGSIDAAQIPEVPAKKGYTGRWPDYDYENLRFSDTLEAIYVARQATIEAASAREGSDVPIVLAEGSFDDKSTVSLVIYKGAYPEQEKGTLREAWTMTINENRAGVSDYTIHYLKPELTNRGDKLEVYALDAEGQWVKQSTRSSGNYLTFAGHGKSVSFCVLETHSDLFFLPYLLLALLVLLLLFVAYRVWRKRRAGGAHPQEKANLREMLRSLWAKLRQTAKKTDTAAQSEAESESVSTDENSPDQPDQNQ